MLVGSMLPKRGGLEDKERPPPGSTLVSKQTQVTRRTKEVPRRTGADVPQRIRPPANQPSLLSGPSTFNSHLHALGCQPKRWLRSKGPPPPHLLQGRSSMVSNPAYLEHTTHLSTNQTPVSGIPHKGEANRCVPAAQIKSADMVRAPRGRCGRIHAKPAT